ncbi:MAG TPA: DUF2065 family protein [Rhodocyclaceae bacterium]|nr:DUF2065 family protein [Rhodocyclaceae bacterium]
MFSSLAAAFGLMLVLEGILPFVAPGAWRQMFRRAADMPDKVVRLIALGSMLLGLLIISGIKL